MAVLMTSPYLQFFDANGDVLAGGKVYTYTATGTFSTLKATYTTEAADVEQPNPVILDAGGRPATGNGSIWLTGTYDIRVTDANDVEIESTLDVTAFTTTAESASAYFESFSGTGSQTEFTTSTDLGTDEKAIFVWVDAGGTEGYEFQNPNAYTIDGTTLTFTSAPASGTNNIYVSSPSSLVGAAASSAADAATSAAAALASETQAGAYAGQLVVTSTTSVSIGTGSKVFTVASGLGVSAGQFIIMASDAAPTTNYMWGQISSYTSTTLTINVTATLGSGSYADWSGYLTGEQGATGATGSVSDISGVDSETPTASYTLIFTDVSDSNNTKKATIDDVLSLGGEWTQLSTQTASSASEVDFDLPSGYTDYKVIARNLVSATDASSHVMLVSTDDGSTFLNTGYDQQAQRITEGSQTVTDTGSSQSSFTVVKNAGNASTEIGTMDAFIIYDAGNTSNYKALSSSALTLTSGDRTEIYENWGYIRTASAVDALRFDPQGNISGDFELWGRE